MTENEIGTLIINTAVSLHKNLGSGLLESVYEIILMKLLTRKGLSVQRQVSIPIEFAGEHFDEGFRVDLFVEGKVQKSFRVSCALAPLRDNSRIIPLFRKSDIHHFFRAKTHTRAVDLYEK